MNESIKQILTGENSEKFKALIRIKKEEIEKKYSDKEKVNEDLLFIMLSNGFINEDYRYYIESSYDALFSTWERYYLNIIKENHNPDFKIEINQPDLVLREIRDYQWSEPSVLNNDILTYLIINDLSQQLHWFINAIQNYSKDGENNNFIDQYIVSISNLDDKSSIIDKLITELSNKLSKSESKLEILLAFFSDNSGLLFCDLLNKLNTEDSQHKWITDFFKKRKTIFENTLKKTEQDSNLKNKLLGFNLEVIDLSVYDNLIQDILIKNGMFQLSKSNLDIALSNQNELPPHYYYDYIRKNPKIRNKISKDAKKTTQFAENVLLTEAEILFSPIGVIDFIFTTPRLNDIVLLIAEKIQDEIIDLAYLPKFYPSKDSTDSVLSLYSDLIHELIQRNKIKVDFNNLLYVFQCKNIEDTILFANKQIQKFGDSILRFPIDSLGKDFYLKDFYNFLLTEEKVSVELFEKESDFLIKNYVDIFELISSEILENKNIPILKMEKLTELAFRRVYRNKDYDKILYTIVRDNISYFTKNIGSITRNAPPIWSSNLLILLRNENRILDEEQIDSIMDAISLEDFSIAIKEWSNSIGIYKSSEVVKRLLTENRIKKWLNRYNVEKIQRFIDRIEFYLDDDTIEKINNIIANQLTISEKPQARGIANIANQYNLSSRVLIHDESDDPYLQKLISKVQNTPTQDIRSLMYRLIPSIRRLDLRPNGTINILFLLGRQFYKELENGSTDIQFFLSPDKNKLLAFSKGSRSKKLANFNPLLCGAVFEGYFDNELNLKKGSKKTFFEELIYAIEQDSKTDGLKFIQDCLALYKDQVVYIPGDSDLTFKIDSFDAQIPIIRSIICYGINILNDLNTKSSLPDMTLSSRNLKSILWEHYTIPDSKIKFSPVFNEFIINSAQNFKAADEIAGPINRAKDLESHIDKLP